MSNLPSDSFHCFYLRLHFRRSYCFIAVNLLWKSLSWNSWRFLPGYCCLSKQLDRNIGRMRWSHPFWNLNIYCAYFEASIIRRYPRFPQKYSNHYICYLRHQIWV